MRHILLTGKYGQVGFELHRALAPMGEVIALDEGDLDLASPDAIRSTVRDIKPQVIVNAAAYTAVDRAESEPQVAMEVNAIAPGVLAEEAKRLGAMIVHYSTDYVFDGTKDGPYGENDAPNPLSVYGRSKLAGDQAIQAVDGLYYILRTSWVYAARGHNFLRTMLRLGRERRELRIVDDQVGAPTWARFVADVTARILSESLRDHDLAREKRGLYNLTASGATSWLGFAQAIFAEARRIIPDTMVPELIAITTADYPLPARRPANSRLDTSKVTGAFALTIPDWKAMLAQCASELPGSS